MQCRLEHTYGLLRPGYARRLVMTRLGMRSRSYVPAVRRQLQEHGLTVELLETAPIWNTRDEVEQVGWLQRRTGWREVTVVSDAMHLRRVRALAQHLGIEVGTSAAPYAGYDYRTVSTPRALLAAFRDWIEEAYNFEVNRLRGWL
jgi:hypothetical protein